MGVRILEGDALAMLRTLPSESVQLVCTSPPYFQLRDYGCPGQIGMEPTPALFIEHLLTIFDEVKRVLRPDGLVFCNLGDSYAGSGEGPTGQNGIGDQERRQGATGKGLNRSRAAYKAGSATGDGWQGVEEGYQRKSLLLIPERFAIGMQERGWICRSQIVWSKASCMPESVRDRFTSAWEPIWMFAKSARYFFDQDAVRELPTMAPQRRLTPHPIGRGPAQQNGENPVRDVPMQDAPSNGANRRNVWHLPPEPSREAHYASFPTAIPRICILAGTSEKGACPACGAPWARSVSHPCEACGAPIAQQAKRCPACSHVRDWKQGRTARAEMLATDWSTPGIGTPRLPGGFSNTNAATGWAPSCSCPPADPVPCVVLDPFLGSGTTALVADRLGRDAIGIELNPTYAAMARTRIEADAPMVSEPVEVVAADQLGLFEEAV
jgi:DNA modification methylase